MANTNHNPKITIKTLALVSSSLGIRIPIEMSRKYKLEVGSTVMFIEQEDSLKIIIKNEHTRNNR